VATAAEPRVLPAPAASGIVQAQVSPQPSPPVPVVRPRAQSVADYVDVTGNAAAVNAVKLVARVEGYLDKIHYEDGQLVKKGDLLFTIQQDQYKESACSNPRPRCLPPSGPDLRQDRGRPVHGARQEGCSNSDRGRPLELREGERRGVTAFRPGVGRAGQVEPGIYRGQGTLRRHRREASDRPWQSRRWGRQQSALAEITQLDPIYAIANLSEQNVLKIRANLGQRRLTLADLHKVPVDVGLSDETGFPTRAPSNMSRPARPGDRNLAGARHPCETRISLCCQDFSSTSACRWQRSTAARCWCPTGPCRKTRAGRYLLVLNKDDVVEQRYVQLGQLIGALRVITSGLKPDDRIVVGDLWRANPGTKVTPQLTTFDTTSTGPPGRASGGPKP